MAQAAKPDIQTHKWRISSFLFILSLSFTCTHTRTQKLKGGRGDKAAMAENGRTPAAKKRAADATADSEQEPAAASRKRAALGDITNLPNPTAVPAKGGGGGTAKKTKVKVVGESTAAASAPSTAAEEGGDRGVDPPTCGAYGPDIFRYLRNMEVGAIFIYLFIGLLLVFLD